MSSSGNRSYVVAIDSGTTGTTVLVLDPQGEVVGRGYHEMPQIYPKPGWVEHDPEEIWHAAKQATRQAIAKAGIAAGQVGAVGITNQRETAIVWDRETGKPVRNAIVWQCRRSTDVCAELKRRGLEPVFRERTGLVLDPYFSGTKLTWMFQAEPELSDRAAAGELAFGTVDTWLLWKLTDGAEHATDPTNASRTLLYNIHRRDWDGQLCEHLGVPQAMLPEVRPSAASFGRITGLEELEGAEVRAILGDQQAALYGQACFEPGEAKNTYGTGCFLLMNTGDKAVGSKCGLLTTLAADGRGRHAYAMEGAVFIAGAAVQWLRDGLGLVQTASESEAIAESVTGTDGVYFVPAFTGLGAPYWDPEARGAILGLTRGTTRAHIVRATLESMAYQTQEVLECMQRESGIPIRELRVDGGAAANGLLMQFQADISDVPVDRPALVESTGLGAAYLAGVEAGIWEPEQVRTLRRTDRRFVPSMDDERREGLMEGWLDAVGRVLSTDAGESDPINPEAPGEPVPQERPKPARVKRGGKPTKAARAAAKTAKSAKKGASPRRKGGDPAPRAVGGRGPKKNAKRPLAQKPPPKKKVVGGRKAPARRGRTTSRGVGRGSQSTPKRRGTAARSARQSRAR